jgi:hypothetical protein
MALPASNVEFVDLVSSSDDESDRRKQRRPGGQAPSTTEAHASTSAHVGPRPVKRERAAPVAAGRSMCALMNACVCSDGTSGAAVHGTMHRMLRTLRTLSTSQMCPCPCPGCT